METDTFVRHSWEQYEETLRNFNYTEEEILAIKNIRENPEVELMTTEQFDFLWRQGIIKRTRKLKKKRSLLVLGNKILYLDRHFRRYNYCGYFVED